MIVCHLLAKKSRKDTLVCDQGLVSIDLLKCCVELQLSLAKKYHLPLFLHSRAAHSDFVSILREEGFGTNGGSEVGGKGGVVHSFTGKLSEMNELVCSILYTYFADSTDPNLGDL